MLLLFGVSIAWNGLYLLAGDGGKVERLIMQLGIIATLSCVAIGNMIAKADFSTDSAAAQLIGFIATLALSVNAITLCSHRSTKEYVGGIAPRSAERPPASADGRERRGHLSS
ncbi:hypothetical protein P8605_00060 [Streptomyces sp. T-3]|nr:hypothetical protein [Streptomyces sp. T-3]